MVSGAHRQGKVVGGVGMGSVHLSWAVLLVDWVCSGSDVKDTLQQPRNFLCQVHHLTRVFCILSCGLILAQLWEAL